MLTILFSLFFVVLLFEHGSCQASLCDGPGRYTCSDGVCISRARLCNGIADCRSGEDESNCYYGSTCEKNYRWWFANGYICKQGCESTRQCKGQLKQCVCDDECGTSCINPKSICKDEPPTVEHAVYRNIRRTVFDRNGFKRLEIVDRVRPPYYLWDMITYTCEPGRRLVGPLPRCSGHRRWSNELPECVEITCQGPIPDVIYSTHYRFLRPYKGKMLPVSIWKIPNMNDVAHMNDVVEYTCEEGFLLTGKPPKCLNNEKWSTHTTQCIALRNPRRNFGPPISADAIDGKEIYLMFEISESVLRRPKDFKNGIEFAKRLVRRMKGFKGTLQFGIMVFASEYLSILDISESSTSPKSIKQILLILDQIYAGVLSRHHYVEITGSGTATANALLQLENVIERMNIQPKNANNKRQCFIFTDGEHTDGIDPIIMRKRIEAQFSPNIEFYSITACRHCQEGANLKELVGLSSKDGENYIYIEDFYQIQSYLDRITDLKFDFAKCGQAGDVGSIKQQTRLRRSIGGEDAAENAWPWQVLITRKARTPEMTLGKNHLRGGGSILNKKWILTAAHIFDRQLMDLGWLENHVVSVGIFTRPTFRNEKVTSTIKMYSIGDYIPHEQYSNEEGNNFEHDIALIKLGPEFDSNMQAIGADQLTFGYYIRPVCLPCTGTCLTAERLVDDNGISLIKEGMSESEKCRIEEKQLLGNDAKVVLTGFGHMNISHTFNPSRNLRQALLQIERRQTCERVTEKIRRTESLDTLIFSDNMFCCKSGDPNKMINACAGDTGNPVVREVKNVEAEGSCWVQVGIVSFGFTCGSDFPGYYTNVARYVPWIQSKTEA
uniref:complement factor B-like n=1 Tax=Styela clava TaxID=7725 RepID=UPI001939560A|nr:complement factor B-like [Styela clava]